MITVLKAKLHRVNVTESNLDYEGSCAIDKAWLNLVGICQYEQIQIYNVSNGERFTTYAIDAPRGSKTCSVRGAASWKAKVGDIVIIAAYELVERKHSGYMFSNSVDEPLVLHFDINNDIKDNIDSFRSIP